MSSGRNIKFSVEITREAQRNLEEVWKFISLDSPARANSFTSTLLDKAESLAGMPRRCPLIREKASGEFEYRHLVVGDYRIIFRLKDAHIEVLAFQHGSKVFHPKL